MSDIYDVTLCLYVMGILLAARDSRVSLRLDMFNIKHYTRAYLPT